jgi:hypothetical protein
MPGRTGGTSDCKWCGKPAIPRSGSVQVCAECQRGVNRVARTAFERQTEEGLSNATMGKVFDVAPETWSKLRKLMEADPVCDVLTGRIDPNHRTFSLPVPGMPTASRGDPWEHRALCRDAEDPDVFFPVKDADKKTIGHITDMYCKPCPVRDECRMRRRRDEGVWGGKYHSESTVRK